MESPKDLKAELIGTYGIHTDRDLFEQLGINNEDDIKKLILWIRYQRAFSYRDGFNEGTKSLEWVSSSELIFDTPVLFLLEHDHEQLIIKGTARKAGDFWDLIPMTGVSYDRNYWNCNKWRAL